MRRSKTSLAVVVFAACFLSAGVAWATGYNPGNLQVISAPGGDAFYNYDFDAKYTKMPTYSCDWPVTIIFTGNASVSRVRSILSTWLPMIGSTYYAYFKDGTSWEWRGDAGRKQNPFLLEAVHCRLYAHNGDKSNNTTWGNYVLCTTHVDHNELRFYSGGSWSGDSERAASQIITWLATKGYKPLATPFDCLNPWPYEGAVLPYPSLHHWQSDGVAALIPIP